MARPACQIWPTVTYELPDKVIKSIDWWSFVLKDSLSKFFYPPRIFRSKLLRKVACFWLRATKCFPISDPIKATSSLLYNPYTIFTQNIFFGTSVILNCGKNMSTIQGKSEWGSGGQILWDPNSLFHKVEFMRSNFLSFFMSSKFLIKIQSPDHPFFMRSKFKKALLGISISWLIC